MNLYLWIKRNLPLIYLTFFLLLIGCVTHSELSPPDRDRVNERLPEERDRVPSRSKELGRTFLKEVRRQYHFIKEPEVTHIVNQVGGNILKSLGTDPRRYHFLIVKEMTPNAFAIPGGYIFITDGLLDKINSVDELAGVLAHEVAHVQRNHFFKDERKILAIQLATIAAILLSQGSIAPTALAQAANIDFQLQFSRENEAEADIYAVSYLKKSGYNPIGLLKFFHTLSFYQRFNIIDQPAYFSTHPDIPSRIKKIENLIKIDPVDTDREDQKDIEDIEWKRVLTIIRALKTHNVTALIKKIETTNMEYLHYLRGLIYLKKGRITKAITEYKSAIEINSINSLYHADLAQCYFLINNTESARLEALKSLTLDKGRISPTVNSISHGILGEIAANDGKYKEAITHYKNGLASMPYDLVQYIRLSRIYSRLGNKAMEAYYLALALRLDIEPEKAIERLTYAKGVVDNDEVLKIQIQREIDEIIEEGI